MPEDGWLDVVAAAERYHCSTQTIRRWAKLAALIVRKERSIGRDGRWVIKTWVPVADLDDVFGVTAREEDVRKIRATAQPFTVEQKVAFRKVFLTHLQEREVKKKQARR